MGILWASVANFFGSLTTKAIITAVGVAAAASVIIGGYIWFKHFVEENATLTANNAILQLSIDQQKQTIHSYGSAVEAWKKSAEVFKKQRDNMAKVQARASSYERKLSDDFAKTDLSAQALKEPAASESAANAGSVEFLGMLACASGSNRDCPGANRPAAGGGSSPGSGAVKAPPSKVEGGDAKDAPVGGRLGVLRPLTGRLSKSKVK